MDASKSLLAFFFLMGFISTSSAYVFTVGGPIGWVENPPVLYNSWSGGMRFNVNDTLVFNYKQGDSVLLVKKESYDSCNVTNPLQKLDSGVYKLDHSGPHYFISGAAGHCSNGEKMMVVVLAIRSPPSPPGLPPPAPAPVVSPPSPSPASVTAPAPVVSPPSPSPVSVTAPAPAPSSLPPSPASVPAPAPSPSSSLSSPPSPSPASVPFPSPPRPGSAPSEAPSGLVSQPPSSQPNTPTNSSPVLRMSLGLLALVIGTALMI